MLWITLLLALLIALCAVGYVVWPLVSKETPLLPLEDSRLADLLARKDSALRAIKDLEFDHQVGKIGDEDYARLRDRLNRQAITLLQQVEQLTPASSVLDAQLEAEIAKLRRVQASSRAEQPAAAAHTASNASVQVGSSAEVATPVVEQGKARFCTECGVKVDPSFKFCGHCGAPIAQLAATAIDAR